MAVRLAEWLRAPGKAQATPACPGEHVDVGTHSPHIMSRRLFSLHTATATAAVLQRVVWVVVVNAS